jgi:ankyrin repeat protein
MLELILPLRLLVARPPSHLAAQRGHLDSVKLMVDAGANLLDANQARVAKAEEMYVRAVQVYEKASGAERMLTLRTVNCKNTRIQWERVIARNLNTLRASF